MSPDRPFTIGALAKATGTKVETIRYYEQIGLLPSPSRTGGNYRCRAQNRNLPGQAAS
jgi:hypothetical protein